MQFAVVSHLIGALAFAVLFLLLLTSWRGRIKGSLLVAAVFSSFLWAVAAAIYVGSEARSYGKLYAAFELLHSVAWAVFFFNLLKPLLQVQRSRLSRWFYPSIAACAGALLVFELVFAWPAESKLSVQVVMLGHVTLALTGLVLTEHLFRNTRPEKRWSAKFLYIGVGTLFAYDFFLYTDALLLQRIDIQIWSARGVVSAMVVPLIAVAVARNPQWSIDIFVSRRIVVHSVAMVGAGLYLLAMGGAGYYVRYFGGTWGAAMQLMFFVGAGLLLTIMLVSGHLRSVIVVFFSKHFFNYKYDYRDEWLRFSATLAGENESEPVRERAIRAIAEILRSPAGQLWTRGDNGIYHMMANWRGPEITFDNLSSDAPLVTFLTRRQWVIDVTDYRRRPDSYPGLSLPQWLQDSADAWVIVPLLQGEMLRGFIVVNRSRVLQGLNWEDWDLLKTAGYQVASYVALVDATEALMDSSQFEAFSRLSAYVVHDLKNVAGQLALVVKNAERHKSNPAFVDDAIDTVANATERMNRMLAQLRKGGTDSSEAKTFAVAEAVTEVVAARAVQAPVPELVRCEERLWLRANRDRFCSVLEHLIQNAQEATPADGSITLVVERDGRWLRIEIRDNGRGMDPRFIRENLFRPFFTTKGNAGMGIGVYESREFVHALHGDISVTSEPGAGTAFVIKLPLANNELAAASAAAEPADSATEVMAWPNQIGNY